MTRAAPPPERGQASIEVVGLLPLVFLVALAALCSTALVAAAGPLRPVALTGTSGPLGPNLGPGITFSNIDFI